MAIVEMKRARLLAMEKDEQSLLKALQKLGCFQITPLAKDEKEPRGASDLASLSQVEDTLTRLTWAISKLGKLDKTKPPLFGGKPSVTVEQAQEILQKQPELMDAVSDMEALERESGECRGQSSRLQAQREQLLPWRGLALPVNELTNTKTSVATLGTVQMSTLEQSIRGQLSDLCVVETISAASNLAYVLIVCHQSAWQDTLDLLKLGNFTAVRLSNVDGTVEQKIAQLEAEEKLLEQRRQDVEAEIAKRLPLLPDMKVLFDALTSERLRLQAADGFAATERTFYLAGWIPAHEQERVEETIKKASPSACVEFSAPEEGDEPPVLLHNRPIVSPFETIVSGFSLPAPNGLDPTAVMTPFFLCFLGMMVSDAGYGLLMALVIPLLIKLMKPSPGAKRLMKILTLGGIATVLWGFLYNTFFGFAPLPKKLVAFDAINNSLPVMIMCIAVGAVHLFTALGVGAYMNIKRGKPLDAIADQLSWFLIIVGLGLMILPATAGIAPYVALTGVAIVLCTAGREKSKNPIKRLISGLGALYGITSWVSDLLSYMRLFGMGLATGVIGMVINQLVGMVFAAGPIGWVLGSALFCGGHLFNAGINILGAYVHSCRLQYIEFFGKFYEDGGKPFLPLTQSNKYVYIGGADSTAR